MKLSRLILSIVIFLGFSNLAQACIINLGEGAFYYTGLNNTRPQNLINNYLSMDRPAFNVSSTLPGPGKGHLPDVDMRDAVPFLDTLNTADLGRIRCDWIGQNGGDNNTPAPVPEPATMLLLGTGLLGLAGIRKKVKR